MSEKESQMLENIKNKDTHAAETSLTAATPAMNTTKKSTGINKMNMSQTIE